MPHRTEVDVRMHGAEWLPSRGEFNRSAQHLL